MPLKNSILSVPVSSNKPMINKSSTDSIAPSIFNNNLIEQANPKPVIHITQYDYTVAIILFVTFVLFVWLFATNKKRLRQVVKAFYINRYANQLARDEVSFGNRVSVFLSTLFVFTLSVFILQINSYFGFVDTANYFVSFLIVGLVIVSTYAIKFVGIKFLGFVFNTNKEASDYLMTIFLFGNTLGLFLMPVVICIAFARQIPSEVFIYFGLTIIGSFLVIRLLRGFIIGFNSVRVSKFYLLVYLCSLEILPFAILVKLFLLK